MAVCVCRVGVVCGGRGGRRRYVHRHRLLLRTSSFSILVRLRIISSNFITSTLRGGGKGAISKNLAPNKFQERLQENVLPAGAICPVPAYPIGGAYSFLQPPVWWGGNWLPLPNTPTPALGPLGLEL